MTLMRLVWHALALVGLVTIGGGLWFASQGVSATATPGPIETSLARTARHWLVPSAERARPNPEPASDETLQGGMAHWTIRDAEARYVAAVLKSVGGQRQRAASILGVSRETLWKKLKALGLDE